MENGGDGFTVAGFDGGGADVDYSIDVIAGRDGLSLETVKMQHPHPLQLLVGDGGYGLRSRRIGTHCLVADELDGCDQLSGASPMVGPAAAMSKIMAHCLDDEDVTSDDREC
ncbi:hypothetical protein ACLOJK_037028 [Asimina triloba]